MSSKSEAKQIRKRLDKAREGLFPVRTCPASRHVHMIVENMLDPKCEMRGDLAAWEPTHMASSIASVLESLWKARRWMKYDSDLQEWVPDMEVIANFEKDRP